ncbi:putative Ig domain-containing protein [Pontiella sulfatireligans]|uniref:Xyloglucanase n=1 Tax=Pontiella sulfatireligans TaxID=2750658 RepID=A0A6C2UQ94_9BACT|nr:putative Ig domain-containing protein [Pontiella sulfatireligans]VGO22462.1 Xyloglucanase [Pontiella sulfatireligans]
MNKNARLLVGTFFGLVLASLGEVVWNEDFEGATLGAASGNNQTLAGTVIQTANKASSIVVDASTDPSAAAAFTLASGNFIRLSVSSNNFSAVRSSLDPIEFDQVFSESPYTLSFDIYIPSSLAFAVGDIQPRFELNGDGGNGDTDYTFAKSSAGQHHIVYTGLVSDFIGTDVNEARPFIGIDQNGETTGLEVLDFMYMDNIHFEVGEPTPPTNEAWFADLRANRVESDPSITWRQFGPGMSGNNYRIYWHPTDPDVVFLGPNMGNGYRSTDRGMTYEGILDYDGQGHAIDERGPSEIQSPDFSRQDPGFGFCSREAESKLYKTTDKGKTWTRALSSGSANDPIWGGVRLNTIAVDPSDDQNWFVGSGDINDRNKFFFTDAQPHGYGSASGHTAKIWKSSDKGDTWSDVTPTINTNACIIRIIVHPTDSDIVWAATTYGLYKSINGGTSWTAKTGTGLDNDIIRSFDMHYDAVSSNVTLYAIDQVKWASAGSTVTNAGGGVFRSDDEGETWSSINGDLGVDVSVLASDYNFRTTYFTMLDKWFGISNAETTYTVYPTNLMNNFCMVRVDPTDADNIFIVNDYKHYGAWTTMRGGMVWRTNDGGTNWIATLRNGTAWEGTHQSYWQGRGNPTAHNMFLRGQKKWEQRESYERKAGTALEFNADGSVIMFQWAKVLCVSYDGGDNWYEIDEIEVTPHSEVWVAAENSNLPGHGFIQDSRFPETMFMPCGENDYWVLEPGGETVRSGYQASRRVEMGFAEYSCSTIAIHPDDTNTIYTLQFRQASAGDLLRSTDGGLTFVEYGIDALEWPVGESKNDSIDQLCLTINPDDPDYMFFCVPDDADVHGYVYDPQISLTTGVRRTTNGGLDWEWANSGLPSSEDVVCVRLDPDNSTNLYACVYYSSSTDGGLYMSTNNAASWYKHPTLPSNIYSVSDIHFANDGKIYVSCGQHGDSDYLNGGVWVSEDDGATWTQMFKTRWARMTKTAAYDPDVILVQMNSKQTINIQNPGTYLSKDGGATWTKINTGNPMSDRVNEIAIDQVVRNRYYVSTQGCGWLRADVIDTNNIAPVFVRSPVVRSNSVPEELYADTVDGEAMDANGDAVTYSLTFAPDWLSVTTNGILTGTPPESALGQYYCQIQADDGKGLSTRETLNFLVSTNPVAYFASWMRGYPGVGPEDGYADDPDGDGLDNLSEYGQGGDPGQAFVPADLLPFLGKNGGTMEYVYRRRKDADKRGILYQLEATTNLVSDSWTNFAALPSEESISADYEAVTLPVSTAAPVQFIRLQIGIAQP